MSRYLKSVDLNHFPQLPLQAAEFNKGIKRGAASTAAPLMSVVRPLED